MAHRKPLGTPCGMTFDTDYDVRCGDVIRSTVGTCYRVAEVRRVTERSEHYPYRHKLQCARIAADDVEADDVVHPMHWHSRG